MADQHTANSSVEEAASPPQWRGSETIQDYISQRPTPVPEDYQDTSAELDIFAPVSSARTPSRMADKDSANDSTEDISRTTERNGEFQQLPHTSSCSPTATRHEPHPTAVSRVFEITELLEIILLHVADDFHKPRKAFKGARVLVHFPAKDLFIVQRVNRKFHDTITSSINLRRLMFLELFPEATEGLPHDCPIPLQWLLYETGFNVEGCIGTGNIIKIGSCRIINRNDRARDLLANLLLLGESDDTSWRQMKVVRNCNREKDLLVVGMIYWEHECRMCGLRALEFYLRLRAGGFVSLGEVRDWLQKQLSVTVEDCEVQAKEIMEKRKARSHQALSS